MKNTKRQYKYAIRRLNRCNDKIQNDKFIAGLSKSDCNILSEIRKFRGKPHTSSSKIDDEVGSKNIASYFASIYSNFYNQVDNGDELEEISITRSTCDGHSPRS